MVAFIPRNYWTISWGGGTIRGEGVLLKQFYPYYFYLTNLVAGLVACNLIFVEPSSSYNYNKLSIILFPVILYCLTAPFTTIMNAFFPYWDFIFTLTLNLSYKNPVLGYYGLISFLLTFIMLVVFVLVAIALLRRQFEKS